MDVLCPVTHPPPHHHGTILLFTEIFYLKNDEIKNIVILMTLYSMIPKDFFKIIVQLSSGYYKMVKAFF